MRSLGDEIAREIDYEILFADDGWVVWSSGLQEWEPIVMTYAEWDTLTFQHWKLVRGKYLSVYKDRTGRFVGSYAKDWT